MGIGSKVFEAQYAALAEARARLRIGRDIVERCLCGSFQSVQTDTEEGQYSALVASVKMNVADWPGKGKPEGVKVEFARAGSDIWKQCRVASASETDGIYSLTLEAEYA